MACRTGQSQADGEDELQLHKLDFQMSIYFVKPFSGKLIIAIFIGSQAFLLKSFQQSTVVAAGVYIPKLLEQLPTKLKSFLFQRCDERGFRRDTLVGITA